jgi:hypothetical protein
LSPVDEEALQELSAAEQEKPSKIIYTMRSVKNAHFDMMYGNTPPKFLHARHIEAINLPTLLSVTPCENAPPMSAPVTAAPRLTIAPGLAPTGKWAAWDAMELAAAAIVSLAKAFFVKLAETLLLFPVFSAMKAPGPLIRPKISSRP